MKKVLMFLCTMAIFAACNQTSPKQAVNENTNSNKITEMNVTGNSFEELFTKVDSAEIIAILAKLKVAEDHTVITAGTELQFNSMVASWEVMGRYFSQPTTFCLLGANRYTLEFIRKQQNYTMSFFPEQFNEDVMAFGRKSGRNSDKMKETKLTYVKTPSGNITYEEANVVIECRLFEITTVSPDDFYTEGGRKFVENALNDANDYHKLVFGTITNVWIKK